MDAHGLRSGIGLLKDLVTYEIEYLNLFSSNNHEQTYGPRVCHFNFNDWTDAQVFGTNVTILSCPHFLTCPLSALRLSPPASERARQNRYFDGFAYVMAQNNEGTCGLPGC